MTKALALCTLTLALVPASAQAAEATFKVSLYGIQRYEQVDHEEPDPPEEQSCWDARGEIVQTTTVRFHTKKPVRMRVTRSGSYVTMRPLKESSDGYPLMVVSDWKHAAEGAREIKSCTDGEDEWRLDPPDIPVNCSATLDWMGFGVDFVGGGKLQASGGPGLIRPLNEPFEGCPYGDHSMELYPAKGRISPSDLLNSREAEVVLRGRERSRSDGAGGDFTSRSEKTTVYVTFKKVG